jgi:hypothetical protein
MAAFKRDLGTHDQIVLMVEAQVSGDPVVTLSEDFPGFADLFGPMEAELGIDPRWYLEIMTPAFAPAPQVIYLRDSGHRE